MPCSPSAPAGRVIVQSRNLELSEPAQDRDLRLAPGIYVCVEIADNGCGIPSRGDAAHLRAVFHHQEAAQHRGLGLAWVYGIVTNHGGGVAVSSQPDAGTSVRVYLPAEKTIVRDGASMSADLNGDQTILMVDDEDLLLTMGQTVLSSYGYNVLTANSGHKALEIFSHRKIPIDLVITDLVMPTMSGRELVSTSAGSRPTSASSAPAAYVRPVHDRGR